MCVFVEILRFLGELELNIDQSINQFIISPCSAYRDVALAGMQQVDYDPFEDFFGLGIDMKTR